MKSTAPKAVRMIGTKIAMTLLLAAAPLVAFGVAQLDNPQVSLAGSSMPDDVDPG
jgi:hypothetical protein